MPIFNGNSPEDFYWQVVRPRYKEFLGATTDKGRAITAIIYAYHLFELVNPIPRNDQTPFRKHVANRYPYDPVFVEYLDAAKKISDGAKHNQDKIETRVERTFSSGFSGGYTKQPLIFAGESKNEILIEDLLNYLVNFWELQSQRGWP